MNMGLQLKNTEIEIQYILLHWRLMTKRFL